MLPHTGEQPGLAELSRKASARILALFGRDQLMQRALLVIVDKVQLAVVILAEGDDALRALGELAVVDDLDRKSTRLNSSHRL